MQYLIDEKKVRLNPYNMKFSTKLGETINSKVYLINGQAYKLYKPYSSKESITKEKIEHYKTISTKRIILPQKSILDKKRNLQGYISKYIEDLGITYFMKQDINQTLNELKLLQEDFILLGENNILVNDASYDNTNFNQGLYIIDCGKFQYGIDENISISYNLDNFNEYIINEIIIKYGRNIKGNIRKLRKEYISKISKGIDILEYIEQDKKEQNLHSYIKRKVK